MALPNVASDVANGIADVLRVATTVLMVANGDDMRMTAAVQPMRPMDVAAVAVGNSSAMPKAVPATAVPAIKYFVMGVGVYLLYTLV